MTSQAYTHADHARACQQAAQRREVLQAWVQVKTSGSAHCARLLDAWTTSDGLDMFKVHAVQPLAFIGSYPCKSVRQCSGIDGRCICSGEAGSVGAMASDTVSNSTGRGSLDGASATGGEQRPVESK